jgi:DNA-binding transcriptional LysR family regulator
MLNATTAGFGLADVPEDLAQPHLAKGRLERRLVPAVRKLRLYYPSRRQPTPAFGVNH